MHDHVARHHHNTAGARGARVRFRMVKYRVVTAANYNSEFGRKNLVDWTQWATITADSMPDAAVRFAKFSLADLSLDRPWQGWIMVSDGRKMKEFFVCSQLVAQFWVDHRVSRDDYPGDTL